MNNFEKVKKFMSTFGQEIKNKPEFPDEKITKLRCDLIEEELSEFKDAVKNKDLKAKLEKNALKEYKVRYMPSIRTNLILNS